MQTLIDFADWLNGFFSVISEEWKNTMGWKGFTYENSILVPEHMKEINCCSYVNEWQEGSPELSFYENGKRKAWEALKDLDRWAKEDEALKNHAYVELFDEE